MELYQGIMARKLPPPPRKAGCGVRCLSSIEHISIIEPAELSKESASSARAILIDFTALCENDIAALRKIRTSAADVRCIGLVDLSSRVEVAQAKALGVSLLVDRLRPPSEVLHNVRALCGMSSKPDIPTGFSETTRRSIQWLSQALDQMNQAAASDQPLPLGLIAKSLRGTLETFQVDSLSTWLEAVQHHHSHTFRHSIMVTGYALAFAQKLKLPADIQALVGLGAVVHDIGKTRIPLAVLDKLGKLSDEEFTLIKKHPVFSREILEGRKEVPREAIDIAVHHHEYLDGSGYPDGLNGEQIGPLVRLITICDIFSALVEKRSYKESLTPRQAYAILREMGSKIDQKLLQQFRPVAIGIADFARGAKGPRREKEE